MIALRAKAVDFEVTYINLREKPDWFLKISPHGKVPVLDVDGVPLFESNAIAEYLDETVSPRLHPEDPIERARNRAWTDFVPTFSGAFRAIYYNKDKAKVDEGLKSAPATVAKLEKALADRGNDGPYFNGPDLSLVDAAYAPFLQRFLIADEKLQTGLLNDFPLVKAWAETLLADDRVTGSVAPEFNEAFIANLKRQEFYVGTLFPDEAAAAE